LITIIIVFFELNEKLTLNVYEVSQCFYATINSNSDLLISENSVKDVLLRMRLIAGDKI
jgi:hypothetical protein